MRPIACPETSVRKNHYSLFNNAEQGSPHLIRGGSLRSRIVMTLPINSHILIFLYYNFYWAYVYIIDKWLTYVRK
jgi:hypothetical protein